MKLDKVTCMEIYPLRSEKSWISNKTGADHCEQVFGAQVDWDEWIEAAMSHETLRNG